MKKSSTLSTGASMMSMFQHNITDMESELKKKKKEVAQLRAENQNILELAQQEILDLKTKSKKYKNMSRELKSKNNELTIALESMETENRKLKENVGITGFDLENSRKKSDDLRVELDRYKQMYHSKAEEMKGLKARVRREEDTRKVMEEKVNMAEEEFKAKSPMMVRNKQKKWEEEKGRYEEEIREREELISTLRLDLQIEKNRKSELRNYSKQLREDLDNLSIEVTQKEEEIMEIQAKGGISEDVIRGVKKIKSKFDLIKEENNELSDEVNELLSFSSFIATVTTAVNENMEKMSGKDSNEDQSQGIEDIVNIQVKELQQHHKKEVTSLKNEHEKEIEEVTSEQFTLTEELKNEKKKSIRLSEEIKTITEEKDGITADLEKKSDQVNELTGKYSTLEKENINLGKKVTSLESKIAMEKKASAALYESQNYMETEQLNELKKVLEVEKRKTANSNEQLAPLKEEIENTRKSNRQLRNKLKVSSDEILTQKKLLVEMETEKVKPLQRELDVQRKKYTDLVNEKLAPLQKKMKEGLNKIEILEKEKKTLKRAVLASKEKVRNLETNKLVGLQKELEDEKKKNKELEGRVKNSKVQINILKQRTESLQTEKKATEGDFEKAKKDSDVSKRQLNMVRLKLSNQASTQEKVKLLENEIRDEKLNHQKTQNSIRRYKQQLQSMSTKNQDLQKKLKGSEEQVQQRVHDIKKLKNKVSELTFKSKKLIVEKEKVAVQKESSAATSAENEELKKKIEELKNRVEITTKRNKGLAEKIRRTNENHKIRMEATEEEISKTAREIQNIKLKYEACKNHALQARKEKGEWERRFRAEKTSKQVLLEEKKDDADSRIRTLQEHIKKGRRVEENQKSEISILKKKVGDEQKKFGDKTIELKNKLKKIIANKTSQFEENMKKKNDDYDKLRQKCDNLAKELTSVNKLKHDTDQKKNKIIEDQTLKLNKMKKLVELRDTNIEKMKKVGTDSNVQNSKNAKVIDSQNQTIFKLKKIVTSKSQQVASLTKKQEEDRLEVDRIKKLLHQRTFAAKSKEGLFTDEKLQLTQSLGKSKKQVDHLKEKCKKYDTVLRELKKRNVSEKEEVKSLKENLEKRNERMKSLDKTCHQLKIKMKKLIQEREHWKKRFDDVTIGKEGQSLMKQQFEQEAKAMKKSFDELSEKMEEKERSLMKKNNELGKRNQKLSSTIRSLQENTDSAKMNEKMNEKHQNIIEKLKSSHSNLKKKLQVMQEVSKKRRTVIEKQQQHIEKLRRNNSERKEDGEIPSPSSYEELELVRRRVIGKSRKLELRIQRHSSHLFKLPNIEKRDTIPQMVRDTISSVHIYIKNESRKFKNKKGGRYEDLVTQCDTELKKLFLHVHMLTSRISNVNHPNNLYSLFFNHSGDREERMGVTDPKHDTISGFYSPYRGLFLIFLHEFFDLKQQCRERIYEEVFPHKRAEFITGLMKTIGMYSELFKACLVSEDQNEKYPLTYSLKNVIFPNSFRKHFFERIGVHYPEKVRQILQTNLNIYASHYDLMKWSNRTSTAKKKNRESNEVPRLASLLGVVQELVPEEERANKNIKLFQSAEKTSNWDFTNLPMGRPKAPPIKTSRPYQACPPMPFPASRVVLPKRKKSEEEELEFEGEKEEDMDVHGRKLILSTLAVSMEQFGEYCNSFIEDYMKQYTNNALLNYKIIADFELPYGPYDFNGTIVLHLHGGEKSQETLGRIVAKSTKTPVVSVDYRKLKSLRRDETEDSERRKSQKNRSNSTSSSSSSSSMLSSETRVKMLQVFDMYRKIVEDGVQWFGKKVERVIVMGEGMIAGNLAASLALLAVWDPRSCPSLGGLVLHYPSLQLGRDLKALPSRFLSLIDPFLPVEILESRNSMLLPRLMRKKMESRRRNMNEEVPVNPLISPLFAPNEIFRNFPPTYVSVASIDPLFDEGVLFAKKISKWSKKDVCLNIFDGMGHGFLNFAGVVSESTQEVSSVCRWMKERIISKK